MSALENADKIEYEIAQNDSSISLSPFVGLVNGPYRGQKVTIILKVPQNREIMYNNYTSEIDIIKGGTTGYYYDYPNKIFKMTPNGLEYLAGISKSNLEDGMMSFSYTGFDRIEIESERNIKVEIKEGLNYKVMVNSFLANSKSFEIKRENGELKIDIDEFWKGDFPDVPVHIQIECPKISEVTFGGIGECFVEKQNSDRIELNFLGATKGAFKGYVETLDIDLAGVTSISLSGTAEYINADIAGSSKLYAFDMITEYANVDVAGVCEVNLFTTEKLTIDASGSSTVTYKGNPELIKDISGISVIKKID